MEELSYLDQDGKKLEIADASAREHIGSMENLQVGDAADLVSAINHVAEKGNPSLTYTQAEELKNIESKEKLSVSLGKIKKAITSLISHLNGGTNPHGTTKDDIGLNNVPNVSTNDQTPTYKEAGTLATLVSGEKLSVSMGKIMKAISSYITHRTTNATSSVTGHVTLSDTYTAKVTDGDAAHSMGASQNALYGAYSALSKDMTAATADAAGTHGLVPAPPSGAQGKYLRGDGTWQTPANNDTKNTAGTTNKTGTKMFLAGATSQGANPQTYSNANVYIGTDNELYSGGKQVAHQEDIETINNSLYKLDYENYTDISNELNSVNNEYIFMQNGQVFFNITGNASVQNSNYVGILNNIITVYLQRHGDVKANGQTIRFFTSFIVNKGDKFKVATINSISNYDIKFIPFK